MQHSTLPLDGIRVIEFTHMVMGPAVGVILADLGAEVIKVEPVGGDNTRRLRGSGAGYFPMYNRNKKSLCVDLKSEEGIDVVHRLVAEADIVIENFRPEAMDRLGFGYATLRQLNPRLIYCSLKGFLSGPYAHRTALDEVTQMMGGLAYMTGLPDRPMRAGSSVIDITGGMFGVIGILAALERRHRTGEGEQVTSSLFETTAFMVGQHMAQQAVTGEIPEPMSVRRSAWSVYDIFSSADGEKVFVGVVSDTLWKAFCAEFELDDFAADPGLAENNDRVAQRDRILPAISALFASLDKDTLCERLERAGVPFAPINRPADLFDDPHLSAAGGLQTVTLPDGERAGQTTRLPSLPLELHGEKFGLRQDIPRAGEHTREILRDLGYTDEALGDLEARGRVGTVDR
jgi:crotonobetainyl-CoA:carnitine CoA-transferase CaiB-like acyl-CoA transferase